MSEVAKLSYKNRQAALVVSMLLCTALGSLELCVHRYVCGGVCIVYTGHFIKVHYIGHHLHVSTFCCIKQKPREAWLNQTTGNTCSVCFGSANHVDCTFQESDGLSPSEECHIKEKAITIIQKAIKCPLTQYHHQMNAAARDMFEKSIHADEKR